MLKSILNGDSLVASKYIVDFINTPNPSSSDEKIAIFCLRTWCAIFNYPCCNSTIQNKHIATTACQR